MGIRSQEETPNAKSSAGNPTKQGGEDSNKSTAETTQEETLCETTNVSHQDSMPGKHTVTADKTLEETPGVKHTKGVSKEMKKKRSEK